LIEEALFSTAMNSYYQTKRAKRKFTFVSERSAGKIGSRTRYTPKVGIVVLNFNGLDCLSECLLSLEKLQYDNFTVIVVDNASVDGSFERAQKMFPSFFYLSQKENRGFAGGMNAGIEKALAEGADYVWLLNNDAEAEENSLSLLVRASEEDSSIGAISPLIREKQSKQIWFAKGKIDFLRMRVIHVEPNEQDWKKMSFPSEFLTGCALLIKREAFEKIGKLDERFFLYYEDADFCLRLKEAGFKRLVATRAVVLHAERSNQNPAKLYYLVLSGLRFFKKHASFLGQIYFVMYVTIRRIKNGLDIWQGRDEARSVRRAYEDFYHGTRP